MDRIAAHLRMPQPKPLTGGINSPFNDAVDRALDTIGEGKKDFAMWCGRLKGFHPDYISLLAAKAKLGKKPIALFSWLIKEERRLMRVRGELHA